MVEGKATSRSTWPVAGFGELDHQAPQRLAVGWEIVAAEHGEGRCPILSPFCKRGGQEAVHGARVAGVGEVPLDIGMRKVEVAGCVAQIRLLGDGQRDDADRRVGHARDQCGRVFGGDEDFPLAADDPQAVAR
jgi:hypothetical protein